MECLHSRGSAILIEFCNTSDVNLSYGLNVTAIIAL